MKQNNPTYHFSNDDYYYMRVALDLARRGLGDVAPNPSVGCVIVKNNHIIGRGWTARGGRPHAETIAIENAGNDTVGARVYVTLEPCAHFGQTPPCTEALIKAGVSEVYIATDDPDERVCGKGIKNLKKANIKVKFGLMKEEAGIVNCGFFLKMIANRPLITVKIASSKDGKISYIQGEKNWVTGPESRRRGHLYRATHDAIMVGIETVLIDDPSLDCRIEGMEHRSPIRIVMDSNLRIPEKSRLCESAKQIPLWIITCSQDQKKITVLKDLGVKVMITTRDQNNQVDIKQALKLISEEGVTRVLCEGGAQLNASLIKSSLVDRLVWFESPEIVGDEGVNALKNLRMNELNKSLNMAIIHQGVSAKDTWKEYIIKH